MKLGLSLYQHMLAPENVRFARQAGVIHIDSLLGDPSPEPLRRKGNLCSSRSKMKDGLLAGCTIRDINGGFTIKRVGLSTSASTRVWTRRGVLRA